MRLDERIAFQPYGARLAALLSATLLTRCAGADDVRSALLAAAGWGLALVLCWALREPLRARRWPTVTPQWAGEAIAALGMLLFLATLLREGVVPALGVMLLALTGAALVIAERRAHLLLLVATCLTQVLMAAAQARSGWFVPCAAAFTLAVLSLFAFDLGATLRATALAAPIGAPARGRGGAVAAVLVMSLALPLYLYVPQPPALGLGGQSARSGQDYSDPRGAPSDEPSPRGTRRDAHTRSEDRNTRAPGDGASESGSGTAQRTRESPSDSDVSDELDLTQVKRETRLANVIVMYVKTSQPVYLRSKLLDRFVGDRWQRTGAAPVAAGLDQGYLRRGADDGGARVTQQIDVVADLGSEALPLSPGATRIRFPAPLLYDAGDGTFAAARPLRADTSYAVDAAPQLFGARYAVAGPRPDARYLQIDAALSPRVRQLAESVTANAGDDWHRAIALEAHLRTNYAYSYETLLPYQGRTPLEWFLFDKRAGHCEFFATAMVILLREAGIPARLANGFSLGERNPLTGFHEVRVLDGHAWAEAWIAGRGWVMFEPTPFYPLPRDEAEAKPRQVASGTDHYLERLAETSAQLAPDSLRTALLQAARDGWALLRHLQHELLRAAGRALPWMPLIVALGVFAASALVLARLAWRDTRERRHVARLLATAQRGAADAPVAAAAAIETALAARGLPRAAGQTWRDYCRTLAANDVALPAGFADVFDAARYGGAAPGNFVMPSRAIAALIEARIAAQPYPRVAARWQAWRAKFRFLPRASAVR